MIQINLEAMFLQPKEETPIAEVRVTGRLSFAGRTVTGIDSNTQWSHAVAPPDVMQHYHEKEELFRSILNQKQSEE